MSPERDRGARRDIVSFKLRPFDEHVWIVRRGAVTGTTLRGGEARRAFALGSALFERVSPGAPHRVRALSVDLERARLLATVERDDADKPDAVRLDGADALVGVGRELLDYLESFPPPS